jgi:hypothetical protein
VQIKGVDLSLCDRKPQYQANREYFELDTKGGRWTYYHNSTSAYGPREKFPTYVPGYLWTLLKMPADRSSHRCAVVSLKGYEQRCGVVAKRLPRNSGYRGIRLDGSAEKDRQGSTKVAMFVFANLIGGPGLPIVWCWSGRNHAYGL